MAVVEEARALASPKTGEDEDRWKV
jgi:hypothetical protein